MRLIKGDQVVDIPDQDVIQAFKDMGWTEAEEIKAEEDPKPKKRAIKSNK